MLGDDNSNFATDEHGNPIKPLRRSLRVAAMTPLRPASSYIFPNRKATEIDEATTATAESGQSTRDHSPLRHKSANNRNEIYLNFGQTDYPTDTPTARFASFQSAADAEQLAQAAAVAVASQSQQGDQPLGSVYIFPTNPYQEPISTVKKRAPTKRISHVIAAANHQERDAEQTVKSNKTRTLNSPNRRSKSPSKSKSPKRSASISSPPRTMRTRRMFHEPLLGLSRSNESTSNATRKGRLFRNLICWSSIVAFLLAFILVFYSGDFDWMVLRNAVWPKPPADLYDQPIPDLVDRTKQESSTDMQNQFEETITHISTLVEQLRSHLASVEDHIKERFSQLEVRVDAVSKKEGVSDADIADLRHDLYVLADRIKIDSIRTIVKDQLDAVLPAQMLVRVNPKDGSIFLDPRLARHLQTLFESSVPSSASNNTTSNHTDDTTFLNQNGTDDAWKSSVEAMISGRLDSMEQRLISKEDALQILSEQVLSQTQKKQLDLMLQKNRESLQADIQLAISKSSMVTQGSSVLSQTDVNALLHSDHGLEMADFALATMGSRPISSHTSRTFEWPVSDQDWTFKWTASSRSTRGFPPITALLADNSLGHCWSFAGQQGQLTVALGEPVIPTHFSIDHISAKLNVDRSSAPFKFSIYALDSFDSNSTEQHDPILLGQYQYDLDGSPVQTFSAAYLLANPTPFVQLRIHSNHGKDSYTCLYRFRVHSDRL